VQFTPESKDESGEVVDLLAALKKSVDKAKASRGEAPDEEQAATKTAAKKTTAKKAAKKAS
jgi:DNA end-binding protein Ku